MPQTPPSKGSGGQSVQEPSSGPPGQEGTPWAGLALAVGEGTPVLLTAPHALSQAEDMNPLSGTCTPKAPAGRGCTHSPLAGWQPPSAQAVPLLAQAPPGPVTGLATGVA